MRGSNRKGTRTDSEAARARKQAEFIASIRRSRVTISPPAATRVIEAEVTARPKATPAAAPPAPPTSAAPRPTAPAAAAAPAPAARPTAPAAAPAPAPAPRPPAAARPAAPIAKRPDPPPAPAAPAGAAAPTPRLFRDEALQHRLGAEEGRGLVRVSPPWTWAILWCVVFGVGAALVASAVGQVEVTSRGRGVVQPAKGIRVLTSQMTGTVANVAVRSGDRVKAGDTLVVVDSATAQAQLLEADRQLASLRNDYQSVASQQDRHYAEQIDHLKAREQRIVEQIGSLRASVVRQQRRLEADEQLLAKGLMSQLAVAETREGLAQAQRQLSGVELSLDQTRQELASMEARRQDDLWQRKQAVDAAQTKRDSLAVVLQEREIKATEDGVVEALTVKPGEVVQSGQPIGRIVPVDSPLHVVSYLAEKDRAFAKPGDEVRLELDQLPHAEYGTLTARIARISGDLASANEIRENIGEGEKQLVVPSYRVELDITDASALEAANVTLRTGALMNVRYTLRRQKLITMVLTPLKRWFH